MKNLPCPVGTIENPVGRPYGTGEIPDISPSDESLGYYQSALTGLLQEVYFSNHFPRRALAQKFGDEFGVE